ncbi:BspA family leucine-rich repeat surface protein [Aliarcobacter butzleri]|uniref:BspA family leucine-rich repeat surface protein n=1 Tax=Aliarcobacter butzleri TaxID=28197 RepID=UPI0024DE1E86|nr:BspA family leucine-rich repeat surface protein [Aliarcobacter butzleri]MDK2063322.1 BspA family leucine-rich repeat surface protein [Aliarcobacter butzleri]
MKKIIISCMLSLSLISGLSANSNFERTKLVKSPIDKNFLSVENGGTKSAIDAYSDGVGLFISGTDNSKIDNSAMNQAVFVLGEEAKKEGISLKQKLGDKNLNADIEIIASGIVNSVIGESCDDGREDTINDIYVNTNGTCVGVVVRSEPKCFGDPTGSEFLVDGVSYLVVDNNTIRNNLNRAETLCVSNVSNMEALFFGKDVNQNISNWDVSNVNDMRSMFYGSSFNQNIINWDVSNVNDMSYMFYAAQQFNQNISSWKTGNVSNFNHMFVYARQFNQDLSSWDTSSVLDKTIFTTTFANRSDLYNSAAPIFYNKNYLPR